MKNYRGVSVLSCPAKLHESYVNDFLAAELRPLLNIHQHAYQPGKSTVTNLVDYVTHALCSMESGKQVDAVYTDFSKAFDLIPHEVLL